MAEIKSTLDLIMERTKNLSLTPEERTEIRLKEIQAKVNGWTQRYIDGLLNASDVKNELESLKEDKDAALVFCRKAALAHIAPGRGQYPHSQFYSGYSRGRRHTPYPSH